MRRSIGLAIAALTLTGCLGFSSKDNEVIGQVKRVKHLTPIVCMDWDMADISLGVMRNGVGSMSTQDISLWVPNKADFDLLAQASKTGQLVKITYDNARFRWCVDTEMVTKVTLVQ